MIYSVELGICESASADNGMWYYLPFTVSVPTEFPPSNLEDYLLRNARAQAEADLAGADLSIAHTWLYSYERMEEQPA